MADRKNERQAIVLADIQNPNLTDEQRDVLFNKATEAPGSGSLLNNTEVGEYTCANCGTVLFKSDAKYESSVASLAGWPSFATAAAGERVVLADDTSYGMQRTEVTCANCGGHLGHIFPDDSSPSGEHYCINSAALAFTKK